jgi:hypothetical protein
MAADIVGHFGQAWYIISLSRMSTLEVILPGWQATED